MTRLMAHVTIGFAAALAGATTLDPLPLGAQIPFRVGAGVAMETYRFSDRETVGIESMHLLTTPFGGRVGLARGLDLELSGAFARGSLTRSDGAVTTLSGLTDTELRLNLGLGRDLITLTAIALLPTGIEGLTRDEADVAGIIAADVFPFAITSWGSGGGVGVSSALAWAMGEFAAGVAVGYVVAGEFEPVADESFVYQPGNQLHVRAALDRTVGTSGKAAVQLTFRRFSEDEVDGFNLYQSGNRLQVVGSYAFAAGARANGIAYGGYLHRGGGEFRDVLRGTAAQDLYFTGAGFRLPLAGGILAPAADLRVLRREDGVAQGLTTTIGASAEWPAGSMTVVPTARIRFGRLTLRQDAESAFTGAELGFALRL